jgi:ribose transport system substrate-binding protein
MHTSHRDLLSFYLLALLLPLAACAPSATQSPDSPTRKATIALVVGVKDDGFYITMEKGARAKARELGVDLVVDGPVQFSAVLQAPIVDAMIARRVDALLIAATDKQAMIEPIRRAHEAGIKVVSVDSAIADGDYENGPITFPVSYIGSDNVMGGRIACEALIKAIGGKGKIYVQNLKPGLSTTDQREQGCRDAIRQTNGAVTLIGVDYNDDNSARAAEQTAAVLQRTPDLSAIFGTNLFSARGAAQAVKNAGFAGTIRIASFDAPEAAIQDLRDNVVDLVIAQKPSEIGARAVEYAVKAIAGDTTGLEKRVPTGFVLIDRNNVNTPEAEGAIYRSK